MDTKGRVGHGFFIHGCFIRFYGSTVVLRLFFVAQYARGPRDRVATGIRRSTAWTDPGHYSGRCSQIGNQEYNRIAFESILCAHRLGVLRTGHKRLTETAIIHGCSCRLFYSLMIFECGTDGHESNISQAAKGEAA